MRKLLMITAVAVIFGTGTAYAEEATQSPRQKTRDPGQQQSLIRFDRFRTGRYGQDAIINVLGIDIDVRRDSDTGRISFGLFNRRR